MEKIDREGRGSERDGDCEGEGEKLRREKDIN